MSAVPQDCVALLRHQLFLPSEVFIAEQARALKKFKPLLVGRTLCGKPHAGVRYHVPTQASAFQNLNYVLRRDPQLFLSTLRDHRPVLVHAHFGVEAVYGMELAERLGVPLVTTFHGFDATLTARELLLSRKPSWIQYRLKRRELQRRGALFVCVSEFIRERLLRLGFPQERIRVHYIGVDCAAFAESHADPEQPVVLHVARLVEQKGTAYLLEAFARLIGRHPGARLVIVGDGPLRDSLKRLAHRLGIDTRVLWLGATAHADVKCWLQRAAILCLPSCTPATGATEGLGLVLLEAAASGVPAVATRHGGIPEAVIDGTTGYLVPERHSESLAEALDALLTSPATRQRFGEEARRMVRGRFDLFRQTQALEQLYEAVL